MSVEAQDYGFTTCWVGVCKDGLSGEMLEDIDVCGKNSDCP